MEAVAAHPVLGRDLRVDRVGVGRRREALVERRVEDGDIGDAGERHLRGPDAGEVGRVVQWREGRQLLDRRLDLGCHHGCRGEQVATVDHAMADDDRMLVAQHPDDRCHRLLVVGRVATGFADALDDSAANGPTGLDLEQLPT